MHPRRAFRLLAVLAALALAGCFGGSSPKEKASAAAEPEPVRTLDLTLLNQPEPRAADLVPEPLQAYYALTDDQGRRVASGHIEVPPGGVQTVQVPRGTLTLVELEFRIQGPDGTVSADEFSFDLRDCREGLAFPLEGRISVARGDDGLRHWSAEWDSTCPFNSQAASLT